jgi:glycosyltransferase involved in cell wall biosynthesis
MIKKKNEITLFSITIPAYKEKFLKETIDSVLAQTYQNYELIIVNDASPYNLDCIIAQYSDSRIHYFKNEKNCGAKDVVDNWNICLSHAKGDYLICMGDDDKLIPCCLQVYADMIEKHPNVDLFHTRTEIIDEESNYICTLEERPEWESVYSLMYNYYNSFIGDWLFKTETLKKNRGFYKLPYGWSSDYISAFIAASNHGVVNINEPGFQYRGNALSISHDLTCIEEKINAVHSSIDWCLAFIADKHPDNVEDQRLIKLIKQSSLDSAIQGIEDMIEFDIRKGLWRRGWFWFTHRKKHQISLLQYVRCVLKAIKYKLSH